MTPTPHEQAAGVDADLARLARSMGVPAIAAAGRILFSDDELRSAGLSSGWSLARCAHAPEEATRRATALLRQQAHAAVHAWTSGHCGTRQSSSPVSTLPLTAASGEDLAGPARSAASRRGQS
jgi:hypothetical protein